MIETQHNQTRMVLSSDGGFDGDKQIVKKRTIPLDPLITNHTGQHTQEQLQKIHDVGYTLSSMTDLPFLGIELVPTLSLVDTEA